MADRTVNIGLFGFGTIGAGVARLLLGGNAEIIARKAGVSPRLKKIVDIDTRTDRGVPLPTGMLTDRKESILDDPEIAIVVELIGGAGVAKEIVTEAIRKGKHVVTANKELIAKHGPELMDLARSKGVRILFEASVGGGIPVLTPLLSCLRANRVRRVLGIVNGTTNFILTEMESSGADFPDILAKAQALGYAEADPTNDIEGHDAAYKAIILAAAAFEMRVSPGEFLREGISNLSRQDISYAKELGYVIKLLAALEDRDGALDIRVHPTLIPASHPLAPVHGVLNAIYIEGDPVGPLMFMGRGAGADATSSAVAGDIIALATVPEGAPGAGGDFFRPAKVFPIGDIENSFFIRMLVSDKPGVLAEVGKCFGNRGVSLASVIQKALVNGSAEIVWHTHRVRESDFNLALDEIRALDCVTGIPSIIRVLD